LTELKCKEVGCYFKTSNEEELEDHIDFHIDSLVNQMPSAYQMKDVFIFIVTSNLGVRGAYRTKKQAQEKVDNLKKGMFDDPKTYEITKTFFELEKIEVSV